MIKGLPDRLKELRQLNHFSQKEVAAKLNISPSIVSGYETGERTPSTENLLAISYLYKCSTDYLLGKSKEVPLIALDIDSLTAEQISALKLLIEAIKRHE